MNETTCPKCGLVQDPERPVCTHMAGRKGGREVAKRGPEFFAAIGKKGGDAAKATGLDYSAIGRLGGRANIEKHGAASMAEVGRKGGNAVKAKLGHAHYEAIGKMGGAKVREAFAALKEREDAA